MISVDYIIVGQGIAGSCVAYRLMQNGSKVLVIDEDLPYNASKVSSGILNPITGRRYAKSWMIDQLLEEAVGFYNSLQRSFDRSIIQKKNVLRGLHSPLDENQWMEQTGKNENAYFYGPIKHDENLIGHFNNSVRFGQVNNSFVVNMPELMHAFRSYFIEKECFIAESVSIGEIEFGGNQVVWHNVKAKGIIFAEGWKVIKNPFFRALEFRPVKGEVAIVSIEDYSIHEVVKNKKFILPLMDNQYWIGSTNQWEFTDDMPDIDRFSEITKYLNDTLKRSYLIKTHLSGIRPATKYRRPFIGRHPHHHLVFLFNGLGTKGVSLAPYWSAQMCDFLLNGKPLSKDVDITRFLA